MARTEQLTLIIDGNNLAYQLYSLPPGIKLDAEIDQLLAIHLGAYAEQHPEVYIDLCLDGGQASLPAHDRVRVSIADYPTTADDHILGRLGYHLERGEPCLVVTSDAELAAQVLEEGDFLWPAGDFIRLPSRERPILAGPPPPPPVASPAIHPATTLAAALRARQAQQPIPRPQTPKRPAGDVRAMWFSRPTASPPPPPPEPGEPLYTLSWDTWPAVEGARFLLDSFCHNHRAEVQPMVEAFGLDSFHARDLRTLAAMLLDLCGGEPDFAARGSLMDRVRLVLLLAGEEGLPLSEIARRTQIKPGVLRRKLQSSLGHWVASRLPG